MTLVKIHFKVLSCGTRKFQIQIFFVDRKKHIYIYVLLFCVTLIQLIWLLEKQIACSSFFFCHRVSCDFICWFFDLDLIWRVTFIHKTKLFSLLWEPPQDFGAES